MMTLSNRDDLIVLLKEKLQGMNPAQARVARFVHANLNSVPFMSCQELAQKTDTGVGTIHRFCLSLGFKGYPHFINVFRTIYPRELSGAERFEKMRQDITTGPGIVNSHMEKNI